MTPDEGTMAGPTVPEERITVDDLRHKALAVRDTVEDEARELLDRPVAMYAIAGAVVFAVALSVAYYLGSRSSGGGPQDGCRCCR